MRSSGTRTLAVLLMLGCAAAQTALGSSLVSSALTLETHGDDHEHSLEVLADGNHLDVVLSHVDGDAHDHGEAPPDRDHPAGLSEGDHVVHITPGDAASATPRRAVVDGSPVVATSAALAPVRPGATWRPSRSIEPRARGVDHLRTVVLRL